MSNKKGIYAVLKGWHDIRLRLFFEGIATGLLSGIIVVSFRLLLERAELLRENIYSFLAAGNFGATALWFGCLLIIACLLGLLGQKEPMISGSGIPQVKGILSGHLKMNWLRVLAGKFAGGVLAIGAGLSLGREGPSVQLGAAAGQGLSRMLGRLRVEEKYLITSGASAGLSAAFNAPLAGAIFALEELHKNFSPVVLTSAMAASITADFVTQKFFGQKPVFDFQGLPVLPVRYYLFLVGLGLAIGLFGAFFNKSLVKSLQIYEKIPGLPGYMKPVIPLFIGGILGFSLPEVLGGGSGLIDSLRQGHYGIIALIVLLTAKFLFTMASYGSGVPGGIFMPLLVIGALAGDIYGYTIVNYLNVDPLYINNFIVFAMAAYFSAIVKAPVTGIVLIMEMTGSFGHLLALTTVSMTAYIASDIMRAKPIYDTLLNRLLAKRANNLFQEKEGGKTLIEICIYIDSPISNKMVKDVSWPTHFLLVGIRRGDLEMIPRGETRILAGDCLIAMADNNEAARVGEELKIIAAGSD